MAERIDREELRALIRDALKEALGQPSPPRGERVAGSKNRLGEGSSKQRSMVNDPSPSRFAATPSPQGEGGGARQGSFSLTTGVLTESVVTALARSHAKIIVGAAVAITPLARDKARELKIGIERQKP